MKSSCFLKSHGQRTMDWLQEEQEALVNVVDGMVGFWSFHAVLVRMLLY